MDTQNQKPETPFQLAQERLEQVRQMIATGELVQDEDYGVIPGTKKKNLLKPGAQKLMTLFSLASGIKEVIKDVYTEKINGSDKRVVEYQVTVSLVNKLSAMPEAEGVGMCASNESKYIKMPTANVQNTVLKMAKKRALVDAVLDATGTSTLFTQDMEDSNGEPQERPQQSTQPQSRPAAQQPPRPHSNGNGQKPQKSPMDLLVERCTEKNIFGEPANHQHVFNILKQHGIGAVKADNLKECYQAIVDHQAAKNVPADEAAIDAQRGEQLLIEAEQSTYGQGN